MASNQVGFLRRTTRPAHDLAGEDVDGKRGVDGAGPGGDVGEVRYPQLVRRTGRELPFDQVRDAHTVGILDRSAHSLAAHRTADWC